MGCNPTWAELIERYTPSQASGLVHHGGFGTTAAGFKAGIPMLVIPHIIDQFIWGNKLPNWASARNLLRGPN